MGETKKLLDAVKEFIIKFLPAKLMKGAPKIKGDQEAAAALARVGELQIQIIRAEADVAEAVNRLQEQFAVALAPIREELARELTKLRDYGQGKGLLADEADSQTLTLPTGRISFYHTPPRVNIGKETDVVEALLKLPKNHTLRQLLDFPPPPPPKLDRKQLLADGGLLKRLVGELGRPAQIMKTLYFAAFPTSQPDLREGMKISGKVKEITVKEIPVD